MTTGHQVGIFNYGVGNLRSLSNAFEHTGANVVMITSPDQLDQISHFVLPGVGAFGHCQQRLAESGLKQTVLDVIHDRKKPVLGICVGMQMLAGSSEEFGPIDGLNICGGKVLRLPGSETAHVPHVGWNEVQFTTDFGQFRKGEEADFYFDHSFALEKPAMGTTIGVTEHAMKFTSVVKVGLTVGAQFHPEKSQSSGLAFLSSFLNMN